MGGRQVYAVCLYSTMIEASVIASSLSLVTRNVATSPAANTLSTAVVVSVSEALSLAVASPAKS